MMRNVVMIKEESGGAVRIGSRITVKEVGGDDDEQFNIVGAAEADPMNGKISNESPLGKELLGKHISDQVEIDAPGGKIKFKIVAID
jgi:transcription elongation factor GreA